MQLSPQLSSLSSTLMSETLRHDVSLHANRDPQTLLSVRIKALLSVTFIPM